MTYARLEGRNLYVDGKALPLEKPNRLPVHLRFDAPVIDIKPEDLQKDDVVNIQERYVAANEYYVDEFVVKLNREKFCPAPDDESVEDRIKREVLPDPVIYVNEKGADELAARLEMQEGGVQWFTSRRRIPFAGPQKFYVRADADVDLRQDRLCEEYTDLPIPPSPPEVQADLEKVIAQGKAERERRERASASA